MMEPKDIKRRNALKAVTWAVGRLALSSVVLIALIFIVFRYPFNKDQNLLEAVSGVTWVVFPILLGNAVIYGLYARRRYHWHNGEDGIGPRVPEPEEPEDPID